MPTYAAFLRAINVGGRRVKSDDLADLFVNLGVDQVNTYRASGNVIFDSDDPTETLVPRIETQLHEHLGYEVSTFLRPMDDLTSLVSRTIFDPTAPAANTKTYVVFAHTALTDDQEKTLTSLETAVDQFVTDGPHIFWLRDLDAGDSMTTGALESALNCPLTRRTMRTVERIVAKFG